MTVEQWAGILVIVCGATSIVLARRAPGPEKGPNPIMLTGVGLVLVGIAYTALPHNQNAQFSLAMAGFVIAILGSLLAIRAKRRR